MADIQCSYCGRSPVYRAEPQADWAICKVCHDKIEAAKDKTKTTFDKDKMLYLIGAVGHSDKLRGAESINEVLEALIEEIARLREIVDQKMKPCKYCNNMGCVPGPSGIEVLWKRCPVCGGAKEVKA